MDAAVQALLDRGEESGCIEYSEVDEVAQTLDLEDEQVQEVYEEIERRGIDLKDNCARDSAPAATYVNGDLAHATTDALQLFMNEVGRYPLLTAKEEVELAKRIERGDRGGEGAHDQLEPAARRLDRQEVPGPRAQPAGPDPGRDHRAHPRSREVRLAPRLQVLDLRDLVDPPGRPARSGEQGARRSASPCTSSSASRRSPAPSGT